MEVPARQRSFQQKKMMKQLTAKREDTLLHSAVRAGNLGLVLEIMGESEGAELKGLLAKQNQLGETALYVAAECGYGDLVKEMMQYYDASLAAIKSRNGYDAFHIAAKQGDLKLLKIFIEADLELSMTFDSANTTALHTAASQGHVEVVNFLLDKVSSLAAIARSNGKTALHSAARNGHSEIVKTLSSKELGIVTRVDKKGQTALHMAVKGQNVAVVNVLMTSDDSLINMVDAKGNTALHIAAHKGRVQIARKLLEHSGVNPTVINKSGETALDTAEKAGQSQIAVILRQHGVKCAKFIKPQAKDTGRELNQTVSDIKHEVHDQLEHTRQTRRHVQGIAKKLSKMHIEGLNNAISSTTVVAVLIATIAFAAIFSVPGQYFDNPKNLAPGFFLGEAHIANRPEFLIFIISDSFALFISLAVVVVQTSVIVIERKAKKQMMAVINKLMWLACVMISVAFLALSYIVVGDKEILLAVSITVIGAVIMLSTLGTMCYLVIINRVEVCKLRSIRRSSMSRSRSPISMSESEVLSNKLYAV